MAVVVLWGAHAHQFLAEALQQQMQQGPVAILFVALTVKLYEGDILALGCSVVSLVFFSYYCPCVLAIWDRIGLFCHLTRQTALARKQSM